MTRAHPVLAILAVRNVVRVHGALVDGSRWRGVYDIHAGRRYHAGIVRQPLTSPEMDLAGASSPSGPAIRSWRASATAPR